MNMMKSRTAIYIALEGKDIKSYYHGWAVALENFEKMDKENVRRRRAA